MKTAVSIPDDVFRWAERHAKASGMSRSKLIAVALEQYRNSFSTDDMTRQANVYTKVTQDDTSNTGQKHMAVEQTIAANAARAWRELGPW
jgi:metal-responsive CopG/Arc/MetJ family transcriptional regulator